MTLTKQQLIDEWSALPPASGGMRCRCCSERDVAGQVCVPAKKKIRDRQTDAGVYCLKHWIYQTQICPVCYKHRCHVEERMCLKCDIADGAELDRHVYRQQPRTLPEPTDYGTTEAILRILTGKDRRKEKQDAK